MTKRPCPGAPTKSHYSSPHPPLRPGQKYLTVEIRTKQKSYYISCPLHPNTDPHALYWCKSTDDDYIILRQDSSCKPLGLHIVVEVEGKSLSIHEAVVPGDIQSVKAPNSGQA